MPSTKLELASTLGLSTRQLERARERALRVDSAPDALFRLAATLVDKEPIRSGSESMVKHRPRSTSPKASVPLSPVKATRPDITKGQSCLDAFRACCASASEQVVQNWRVVVDNDDPEGPHQMRVGLRRFRTALRMFRPLLEVERFEHMNAALADLGHRVVEIRDLDVLAADVIAPVAERVPHNAGLRQLLESLGDLRARWRDELRVALTNRTYTIKQIEIALFPDGLEALVGTGALQSLSMPIEKAGPRIVAKRWKRVARYAKRLDDLSVEERHEMRKQLKTLRYTVDFLQPIFPKKHARAFLRKAARMQDVFGYLSDAALARRLPELQAVIACEDARVHRAVGQVIGWHDARSEQAWQFARQSWQQLRQHADFWT